ncbi:hypothetical protein ACOSP7_002723 [Xanthoceras sorbifolium]
MNSQHDCSTQDCMNSGRGYSVDSVIPVRLATCPSHESKSRLPLELCEIGLRDLVTRSKVVASDRVSIRFQLEHLPLQLGQMLGLRDLSSGEPSSEVLHKNDWNRQKSLKRPKTRTLKENIKNAR